MWRVQSSKAARPALSVILGLAMAGIASPQNRIDVVTPAAPDLASYGPHEIGVRTIEVTDRNRVDILNTKEGGPEARYDRTLTVEVWYPATLAPAQAPRGEYQGVVTRDPSVIVTLNGRAVRDQAPSPAKGGYPLVIVSHGFPGNRFLLAHLCENLASKGYVVAAIDHRDSTYDDWKAFASTLYNRSFDVRFVLNELDRKSHDQATFLSGLVDASRTGVVGYSMGGHGVLNLIGGGFSKAAETMPGAPPNRLLAERGAENPAYIKSMDPRIKAAIAIAPWGMEQGYWDAAGLSGITTPLLLVAGSADDVSGYEKGARAIFRGAVNADRYLLTFLGAGHNAAAPIPAPAEIWETAGYTHYLDAVWDTTRMNNIMDHFAAAFFGVRLKGEQDKQAYLDVVQNGKDGVYAVDKDGKPTPGYTYWKGFKRRMAAGLVLEHLPASPH